MTDTLPPGVVRDRQQSLLPPGVVRDRDRGGPISELPVPGVKSRTTDFAGDAKPNFDSIGGRLLGVGDAALNIGRHAAGLVSAGAMGIAGVASGQNLETIGEVASTTLEKVGGEPFTQQGDELLQGTGGVINDQLSQILQLAAGVGGVSFAQRIGDIAREEGVGEGLAEVAEPLGPAAQAVARVVPDVGLTLAGTRAASPKPRTIPPPASQVTRAKEFADIDVTPTRANITRRGDDFTQQADLLKESDTVRSGVAQADRDIAGGFDKQVDATGGRTAGTTVSDEIINRSTRLDNEINTLYKQARERSAATDNPRPVDLTNFNEALIAMQGRDRSMQGMPASVNSILKETGIVDANGNVVRGASFTEAEQIRAAINSHFDSTSGLGRRGMHELKEALDADVFKVAGEDIFSAARSAKRNFEQGLNKAKISKFDTNRTNLVRDVLESKIDAETLVRDVAFRSGKYKSRDIQQLKDYLVQSPDGVQVWQDFRAQVMSEIKTRAFKGAEIVDGVQSITITKLNRALDNIGLAKLDVILEPKELGWIRAVQKVAKSREPVAGTAIGSGPTGQAVQELGRRLEGITFLGGLVTHIRVNRQGKVVLDGTPQATIQPTPKSATVIPGASQIIDQEQ